jgi:hypothetical protein
MTPDLINFVSYRLVHVTAGFEQSLLGRTQQGQINILLTHTPKVPPELFGTFVPSRVRRRFC